MKKILILLMALSSCTPVSHAVADELSKLTEALYFEDAMGDSECQIMVANVIMNRVAKKNWPNDIISVIEQPNHFSYLHDDKPEDIGDWDKYVTLARLASGVMNGDIVDNTDGADHYINKELSSATWWKDMHHVVDCGDHSFYRRDWR